MSEMVLCKGRIADIKTAIKRVEEIFKANGNKPVTEIGWYQANWYVRIKRESPWASWSNEYPNFETLKGYGVFNFVEVVNEDARSYPVHYLPDNVKDFLDMLQEGGASTTEIDKVKEMYYNGRREHAKTFDLGATKGIVPDGQELERLRKMIDELY